MKLLADKLYQLQLNQLHHDERFHKEVVRLPVHQRINHMAQPPMSDEAKKTREGVEKELLANAQAMAALDTIAANTLDKQLTVTAPIEIKIQIQVKLWQITRVPN